MGARLASTRDLREARGRIVTAPLPGAGNRGGADHVADASKKVDNNFAGSREVLPRSQNNFPEVRKVQLLESGRCTSGCLTAGRPRKRCTCRCGGRWHGRLGAVERASATVDTLAGGAA